MNIHELVRFRSPEGPKNTVITEEQQNVEFTNESLESLRQKLLLHGTLPYVIQDKSLCVTVIEGILSNGNEEYHAQYSITSSGQESQSRHSLIKLQISELNYGVLGQKLDVYNLVDLHWGALRVLNSGIEFHAPTSEDVTVRNRFISSVNNATVNAERNDELMKERVLMKKDNITKSFFITRGDIMLEKDKVVVPSVKK
jgi:hypothetical protein